MDWAGMRKDTVGIQWGGSRRRGTRGGLNYTIGVGCVGILRDLWGEKKRGVGWGGGEK